LAMAGMTGETVIFSVRVVTPTAYPKAKSGQTPDKHWIAHQRGAPG
jgi:hypothetical protein